MIRSFVHKGLKNFHYDGNRKGIQSKHVAKLSDILDILEFAVTGTGSVQWDFSGKSHGFVLKNGRLSDFRHACVTG